MSAELKNKLTALFLKYSTDQKSVDAFVANLFEAYSDKKRHYHNLDHIRYLNDLAEKYKELIEDWDALSFSIWYHDIVYNVFRKDNEERSAKEASQVLTSINFSLERIHRCISLISSTKTHTVPPDFNSFDLKFFLDCDLAILGSSFEEYMLYASQIRKEYRYYPDFMYNKGRKEVLHKFLGKSRIYLTDLFFSEREKQARMNIQKELDLL